MMFDETCLRMFREYRLCKPVRRKLSLSRHDQKCFRGEGSLGFEASMRKRGFHNFHVPHPFRPGDRGRNRRSWSAVHGITAYISGQLYRDEFPDFDPVVMRGKNPWESTSSMPSEINIINSSLLLLLQQGHQLPTSTKTKASTSQRMS